MNELLAKILDAHGGMDRWNGYQKVGATIVTGGGFFALKGVLQDHKPSPHDRLVARGGEALWTYLTTPFLLEETESWREGEETWRVLRAYFPGSIETHNLIQDFLFSGRT